MNQNQSFFLQNKIALLRDELKESRTKLAREIEARGNVEAQNVELCEQLLAAKAKVTLISGAHQEDQVRNLLVLHALHQSQNDPATQAVNLELKKQVEEEKETRIASEKQCSHLKESVLHFKMRFHCERKVVLRERARKTQMGDIEKRTQAQISSLKAALAEAASKNNALQEQITFLAVIPIKDFKKTQDKRNNETDTKTPNSQLRRQPFVADVGGSLLWLALQRLGQECWSKVVQ